MRPILLLAIIWLLFWNLGHAQYVNIPDPLFKQRCIDNGYDTTPDGEIDSSEAATVLYMELYNDSITDLTGIGAFVNLVELNCNYNFITSFINAYLPNLTKINCISNELDTIDLTGFPNLEYLDISSNNIANLDFSSSNSLKHFKCDWNQIQSLDLSNCTAIEWLFIGKNPMTSIDLSNQINLEFYVNGTDIESLDLTNNLNLKKLSCGGENIVHLDITDLTNLNHLSLTGAENLIPDLSTNINLDTLFAGHMNLGSLHLEGNPNLIYLTADYSNLYSVHFADTMYALKWVNFNNNNISSLDFTNASNLYSLEVINNNLSALLIHDLPKLYSVMCGSNQLTNLNLSGDTSLYVINMNHNSISTVNYGNNINLHYIHQKDNQLTQFHNLWEVPNLYSIDASENSIIAVPVINPSVALVYLNDSPDLQLVSLCQAPNISGLVLNGSPGPVYIHATPNISNNLNVSNYQGPADYYILTNCPLNIDLNENFDVQIFPNPSNGYFTVETDEKDYSLSVNSINGQVIYKKINCSLNTPVQIETAGIYIVSIETESAVVTKKVVIN